MDSIVRSLARNEAEVKAHSEEAQVQELSTESDIQDLLRRALPEALSEARLQILSANFLREELSCYELQAAQEAGCLWQALEGLGLTQGERVLLMRQLQKDPKLETI
eukprot:TRINITY_DN64406_c0_g1_i1.p2 TRINITY_DN64406_c0_g1~~TRINITY_DN64406_c0_g1_i1.p2  ORF type:complete len:107 (-),score=32.01 TRINITY_DN64406_c0_g1_i1:25-345(-)